MEQRTSYRIPFDEKVKFGYLSRPYYDGTIANISETGFAVKSNDSIPENTTVTVIIYYMAKPIENEGEIRRLTQCYYSNQYEMGINITTSNQDYNSIYLSMLNRV